MTAIFYPDCHAASPSGRFTLEARSPHNGTIPYRDGRSPSERDFAFKYRQHQREFRYRLLDHASGSAEPRVVWERWQGQGEDSPHELLVSDDGWSILRTHGFNPEVIAVSPAGRDTLQVQVLKAGHTPEEDEEEEREPREGRREVWHAEHLVWSTAGTRWAQHSWPFFFRADGTDYFVWRTCWGQRLVLDLTHAALVPEDSPAQATLARVMDDEEKRGVSALLADLSERVEEAQRLLARRDSEEEEEEEEPHPLSEKLERAVAALHLAGVHRLQECVPFLQRWEAVEARRYSTDSVAFGGAWGTSWMLEAQAFRPILHHSLRLLGVQPQGYAAFRFRNPDKNAAPIPEQVTGRRQRSADLDTAMPPEQVLRWMGPPDHVRKRSHPVGTLYRWTEEWEYDFQVADGWVTLRLTWEQHKPQGRLLSIQEVPASWLQSDERVLELLGH